MPIIDTLKTWAAKVRGGGQVARLLPNEDAPNNSERGRRATPEDSLKYLYRTLWVDPDVRQTILDIRNMDLLDGRVKRIHGRVARDVVRGGLVFSQAKPNDALKRLWEDFNRRLQLNRPEKLRSDARGLVMEGNLPLQWVMDKQWNIVSAVRMPSETIIPNVDANGRFIDVTKAYTQMDPVIGTVLAEFPLWQLFLARHDPTNFDDMGALGRPFLDASRATWKKLRMTEEDLVIRRRVRAPLRLAHVLEGADPSTMDKYRGDNERDQHEITTDFYLNRKGSVTAIQGDANLDQIADVVHLLDTFFAGTPLPKGLMGYTDALARDILQDLKQDYYEEVDGLQDTLAFSYAQGFMLNCLLQGVNPDAEDFTVKFAERRTETPTQTTDRGLKLKAMGLPEGMVWEELGYDPATVKARRDAEAKDGNPYPEPNAIAPTGASRVSITPNNAPKGDSATSIKNPKLSEHWQDEDDDNMRPSITSELIKSLGDMTRHLADRPAPAPATVHVSLPEIKIPTIQVNVPDVHLDIPAPVVHVAAPNVQVDVAAPDLNIPPPVVNVAAPVVNVAPAEVHIEATLPAPDITVNLPPRQSVTEIERDSAGDIKRVTQTEKDA